MAPAKQCLAIAAGFLLLATTLLAGSRPEKAADRREIRQDKNELYQTGVAMERLTTTMDNWVDANLQGKDKDVDRLEKVILQQIETDIAASRQQIERAETEVISSRREYHPRYQSAASRHDNRLDLKDDVRDLTVTRKLLKAKQQIAASLQKTAAFSNKYRLLGDYIDLLRRELGMTRLELAEDIKERREDHPILKR